MNSNTERSRSWSDENRHDGAQSSLVNDFCLAKQLKTAKYESHVQQSFINCSVSNFHSAAVTAKFRDTCNKNFLWNPPKIHSSLQNIFLQWNYTHARCIFVSLGRWQMTFSSWNFCIKCDAGFLLRLRFDRDELGTSTIEADIFAQRFGFFFFSQPHIWEKVHFCVFTLRI